jgi:hypothetical protein
MKRISQVIGFAAALCLSAPLFGEGAAEIRFFPADEGPAWVGEKRDVHLELWTEDVSFSGQSLVLPDVSGAYLMLLETSSLKLSETRNGVPWQGLRYTLALLPQRAGVIEIPPFEVRFSSRADYLGEAVEHVFTTSPLTVEARLPEGADGGMLVTTSDFTLSVDWRPAADDAGVIELKTGDAVVLELERRARDVPGMVFSPLPAWSFDGLGIYTDQPKIDDVVDRGSLTGRRSDRITLICEKPGRYELPGLRFEWWDPQARQLREEVVPAIVLDVSVNPAWATAQQGSNADPGFRIDGRIIGVAVAFLALTWPAFLLGRMLFRWLRRELRARRLEPLNPRNTA